MKHFIIGLGGTGGRIIRALRKSIVRDFPEGGGRPVRKLPGGGEELAVPLGFLYVDSNEHELFGEDGWSYLGRSVLLEDDERLHIRDGNLGAALDQLAMNPSISRWLGDQKELGRIFRSTMQTPGANQIRRWGRFLFANSAARFCARVVALNQRLGARGGTAHNSFHICCTLAGGTGSGSVVDAVMQLRKVFGTGQGVENHIYLYCLVTEAPCTAATGNFYANQYAALKELNALVAMQWHPHDVTGDGARMEGLRDRFKVCFLITDKNREAVPLSLEKQEELVAEYLYNRIVVCPQQLNAGFVKSWTFEDVQQYSGEPSPDVRRSYFFGTIGVKRWAVPVGEIEEKLTYECMASVCRQMLNNRWDDNSGFADQPKNDDYAKHVDENMQGDRWRLSDDATLLRRRFELQPGAKPVPSWDEEWRLHTYAQSVEAQRSGAKPAVWLAQIRQQLETFAREGFRGLGIERYYLNREAALNEYATSIAERIATDLWDEWRAARHGLADVRSILETLEIKLSARIEALDAEEGEAKLKHEEIRKKLDAAGADWVRIGWLAALWGARRRALAGCERRMIEMNVARTHVAAIPFQRKLLAGVRDRITVQLSAASGLIQPLQALAREMADKAGARCLAGQGRQFNELVVREYDPQVVGEMVGALRQLRTVQHPLAQSCREAFELAIAPEKGLVALERWMKQSIPRALLETRAADAARQAHAQVTVAHGLPAILDVGILDKLRQRYQGQEDALRRDVKLFMDNAATAALQDTAQLKPRDVLGNSQLPDMPKSRVLVLVPGGGNQTDAFARQVVDRFEHAGHPDFAKAQRREEITVLTADYWMAARFFRVVQGLKAKYVARLGAQPAGAIREVHLEDHERELPDLLLESGEVNATEGQALLLLGEELGGIVEREVGGQRRFFWEVRDASGMTTGDPELLAERREHFGSLALPQLSSLREKVAGAIRTGRAAAPNRAAFIEPVKKRLSARRAAVWEAGGETPEARNRHPDFLAFNPVVKRAEQMLEEMCP